MKENNIEYDRRRERAIGFSSRKEFETGAGILESIASHQEISFEYVGDTKTPAFLLPTWSFEIVFPEIKEKIPGAFEMEVVTMSELSLPEQRALRGRQEK